MDRPTKLTLNEPTTITKKNRERRYGQLMKVTQLAMKNNVSQII